MCETANLRTKVASLIYSHGEDAIPYGYYDRMMIIWQSMNDYGENWDINNAAAALLFTAHIDGYIHKTQINPKGLHAMAWADQFLQKTEIVP